MGKKYQPYIYKSNQELSRYLKSNGILNLSRYKLRDNEIETLALGLGFIPTTAESVNLKKSVERWMRSIDISLFFTKNRQSALPQGWLSRIIRSTWDPPPQSWTENEKIKEWLNKLTNPSKSKTLLTPKPILYAIDNLSNQVKAHILKSDKGRNTVLWDIQDYDREAERQFKDTKTYKQLTKEIYIRTINDIAGQCRDLADNLLRLKHITEREYNAILGTKPSGSFFYMLPKIHKPINSTSGTYTGRPIVATFTSTTHLLDKYITELTKPLLTLIPGSLRDTFDLIEKLPKGPLKEGAQIVTADVESLYPSIPWKEGLDAAIKFYTLNLPGLKLISRNHNKLQPPSGALFGEVLETVLKNSIIIFKEKMFFHQIKGTAMGMCISVYFANTYMYELTKSYIERPPTYIQAFYRFIDDLILITYPYSHESTISFFNGISNPSIRYNISHPQMDQPFLDIKLNISTTDKKITTAPYWKPTATGTYLHPASNHPKHTIRSIPYAQYLRLKRLSSSIAIFKKASRRLTKDLAMAGYNRRLLKQAKAKSLIERHRGEYNKFGTGNFFLIERYSKALEWSKTKDGLNKVYHLIIKHYESDLVATQMLSQKRSSVVFSTQQNIGQSFFKYIKKGLPDGTGWL